MLSTGVPAGIFSALSFGAGDFAGAVAAPIGADDPDPRVALIGDVPVAAPIAHIQDAWVDLFEHAEFNGRRLSIIGTKDENIRDYARIAVQGGTFDNIVTVLTGSQVRSLASSEGGTVGTPSSFPEARTVSLPADRPVTLTIAVAAW